MSDELPPLPHLGDKFTLEEMQHYAREAVRAAVERERAKYEADYRVHERAKQRATELEEKLAETQAKTEKGLEPVAWIHPLDIGRDCGTTAKQVSDEQIPLAYAHPPIQVEPVALRRAFSVLTDVLREIEGWEDKALPEAVAASRAELLTLIYAHPPAQAEPVDARAVASILERLENDMCGSNARQDAADLIRKLIAHPPTSEWNDASRYKLLKELNRAGKELVVNQNIGHDWTSVEDLDATLDALKREPR